MICGGERPGCLLLIASYLELYRVQYRLGRLFGVLGDRARRDPVAVCDALGEAEVGQRGQGL